MFGLNLDERLAGLVEYPDDYRIVSSGRISEERLKTEERPLSSMKYTLIASQKGASNQRTGQDLGNLLSAIHTEFDENSYITRGAVVYQDENGEYVLSE